MEKKLKRFFLLSSINILPALILGGGATVDSAVLVGVLLVLMVNHLTLVKMVKTLHDSMVGTAHDQGSPVVKILGLFFLKFLVIGLAVGAVYYFNKNLIPKVMLLMIFQLIIQVVSIKNNYQN